MPSARGHAHHVKAHLAIQYTHSHAYHAHNHRSSARSYRASKRHTSGSSLRGLERACAHQGGSSFKQSLPTWRSRQEDDCSARLAASQADSGPWQHVIGRPRIAVQAGQLSRLQCSPAGARGEIQIACLDTQNDGDGRPAFDRRPSQT
jgi:hypothetical protein